MKKLISTKTVKCVNEWGIEENFIQKMYETKIDPETTIVSGADFIYLKNSLTGKKCKAYVSNVNSGKKVSFTPEQLMEFDTIVEIHNL